MLKEKLDRVIECLESDEDPNTETQVMLGRARTLATLSEEELAGLVALAHEELGKAARLGLDPRSEVARRVLDGFDQDEE